MKLKIKMVAEPTVPATAEMTVEVPDEYRTLGAAAQWVEENLVEILNTADKNYEAAYSAYVRSNYTLPRPEWPYRFTTDDEDVNNNIVNSLVELEEWEVEN